MNAFIILAKSIDTILGSGRRATIGDQLKGPFTMPHESKSAHKTKSGHETKRGHEKEFVFGLS